MSDCRWITLEELETRQAEWRRLTTTSEFPSAFTDPAWILGWWHNYGEGHEPWLFVLEDSDGSLRGIAPLALRRSSLTRMLMFAGGNWNGLETLVCLPGYETDFSASLLEALVKRRREWDVWHIQRLCADSILAHTLLGGDGPLRAAAHEMRLQPFLELPDDVATLEASFSAKERGAQRRKWRRLSELGTVARLISDPEEASSGLGVLLNLRRRRAIALGQSHEYMDARYERFLSDAVRGLLPDGARLWTLELDGHALASCLHLVQGPREHTYVQGIADEHVNLSPGNSLELHAIREAIGERRSEFEFGAGRHDYKYRLGATDRKVTRLVVSSRSARGHILSGLPAGGLRLRNTAAAEALRRRRGLTPERATAAPPAQVKQQANARTDEQADTPTSKSHPMQRSDSS